MRIIFILVVFVATNSAAEIYRCKDQSGKPVFQGEPCTIEERIAKAKAKEKAEKDRADFIEEKHAENARASEEKYRLSEKRLRACVRSQACEPMELKKVFDAMNCAQIESLINPTGTQMLGDQKFTYYQIGKARVQLHYKDVDSPCFTTNIY